MNNIPTVQTTSSSQGNNPDSQDKNTEAEKKHQTMQMNIIKQIQELQSPNNGVSGNASLQTAQPSNAPTTSIRINMASGTATTNNGVGLNSNTSSSDPSNPSSQQNLSKNAPQTPQQPSSTSDGADPNNYDQVNNLTSLFHLITSNPSICNNIPFLKNSLPNGADTVQRVVQALQSNLQNESHSEEHRASQGNIMQSNNGVIDQDMLMQALQQRLFSNNAANTSVLESGSMGVNQQDQSAQQQQQQHIRSSNAGLQNMPDDGWTQSDYEKLEEALKTVPQDKSPRQRLAAVAKYMNNTKGIREIAAKIYMYKQSASIHAQTSTGGAQGGMIMGNSTNGTSAFTVHDGNGGMKRKASTSQEKSNTIKKKAESPPQGNGMTSQMGQDPSQLQNLQQAQMGAIQAQMNPQSLLQPGTNPALMALISSGAYTPAQIEQLIKQQQQGQAQQPQHAAQPTVAQNALPGDQPAEGYINRLLQENGQVISKIKENLSTKKVNENLFLIGKFRENIIQILTCMSTMSGIMSQMPPIPVKLNTISLPTTLHQNLTQAGNTPQQAAPQQQVTGNSAQMPTSHMQQVHTGAPANMAGMQHINMAMGMPQGITPMMQNPQQLPQNGTLFN